MKAHFEDQANVATTVETFRLEMERCQRELGASQKRVEQLEGLFTHVADAILVADMEGQIIDANPAACALLGYSVAELRTMHPWDFVTSASREEILNLYQNIRPGLPAAVQCTYRSKKGEPKTMDLRLARSNHGGGDVIIISCRDVTDHQNASVDLENALGEIKQSEAQFQTIVNAIPGLVWSTRTDGYVEYLNQRWMDYTGLKLEQGCGWGWLEAIHPDDNSRLVSEWKSILTAGKPAEAEARLRRFDGKYRWFLFRCVPFHDKLGNLVKWYGSNTDIEDRKRAEALLGGEKRLLEMVAKGDSLSAILDAACRLVETLCNDASCSIMLLDSETQRMWHAASPSLPKAYTEAADGFVIGPAVSSCGTAAYTKKQVIASDIASDPLWADFRAVALENGLRACWSTPIFSHDERVLGTFAMLYRETKSPAPEELEVIEQITHLVSIAIERKRTEGALRENEEALRKTKAALEFTLESAQVGDWDLDLIQDTSRRSPRHDQCFGYNTPIPEADWGIEAFIRHVHPTDRTRVENSLRLAAKELQNWASDFRVVWPDGSEHWIAAQGSIYRTKEEQAARMLGTVVDITERKRGEEALAASEQLARGQVATLKSALDALAMESDPDCLVGHILRTITEQFGAHSSSVWRRDESSGMIGFEFAFEDGKVVTKADPRFAGMDLRLPMEDFWPWPEVFRMGKPSVIEDIRTVRPFALRDRLLNLGIITVLLVPMSIAGRLEGAIGLRFKQKRTFRPEEMELAQALANQAMLAMQLTCLYAQSRESAVIAERNRMARDIHDTLAQGFTGVIVQLEAAADATSKGMAAEAIKHVDRAGYLARESLKEARRSVRALRPQALEEKNLCEALDELIRKATAGTTIQPKFTVQGQSRLLPPEWDENLLRIGQEVLTNSLRHAHASEFEVQVAFAPNEFRLKLGDNGLGFDLAAKHDGFGVLGIKERVEVMGGKLTIESSADKGTTILIVLPYAENGESSQT